MEAILFILKVAGLAMTTSLGVIGTVHDYRDKVSGHLTRWGRVALIALILSASVAIIAQVVEESLKDKSTKEAAVQAAASAARSEQIVNNLARVLQPLEFKSLHISELQVPLDSEKFKRLRTRIDATAADYQKRYQQNKIPLSNQGVSAPSITCENGPDRCSPLSIEIDHKNPAFPKSSMETAVFRIGSVLLAFYRTPIDPARFEHFIVGGVNDADLSLHFGDITGEEPFSLSKEVKSDSYKLTGTFFSTFMRRDTSGRVVAIPDLSGSQIFLRLPTNSLPDNLVSTNFGIPVQNTVRQKQSDVLDFQRRFELGAVAFEIGARTMWVPKTAWRKHVTKTAVFWEYVVPADPFKFGPDGPR